MVFLVVFINYDLICLKLLILMINFFIVENGKNIFKIMWL